jgi:hypothetical protein
LKKDMGNNAVSVLGVSEVRWKGQGDIRSDDYTVYCSGVERTERDVAMVYTNTVRSLFIVNHNKFSVDTTIVLI